MFAWQASQFSAMIGLMDDSHSLSGAPARAHLISAILASGGALSFIEPLSLASSFEALSPSWLP